MFSRSREYTDYIPLVETVTRTYTRTNSPLVEGVVPPDNTRFDQVDDTLYVDEMRSGTIQDDVIIPVRQKLTRSERLVLPFTGTRRRSKFPRVVKPVEHTKKHVYPYKDACLFVESVSYDNGLWATEDSYTTNTGPAMWVCNRYGADYVKNLLDSFTVNLDDYIFHHPDWFSIVSDFNENVDQLIPSNFFAGESIAESSIYGDVLRAIIQPKKFVTRLFEDVTKKALRHLNAREIRKFYSARIDRHALRGAYDLLKRGDGALLSSGMRTAIDAHLTFKFGVEPALNDIASTVAAHASVPMRLDYLSRNAGAYLPIRVRKKIPSSFNSDLSDVTPYVDLVTRQSSQDLVAVMFAMGRVRDDISEASAWRAYTEYFGLNKLVGTWWELQPFSFVIDWFTNTQERINQITRIRLGDSPFYNLASIGSSIKEETRHQVCITPGYDLTLSMDAEWDIPIPAYEIIHSRYVRTPGIPDTSGVVDLSTLGLFHGVTSVELLLQKLRL